MSSATGLIVEVDLAMDVASVVFLMRAYAFSGHKKIVLVILSALLCLVTGAHMWFFWVKVPTYSTSLDGYFVEAKGGYGCFIDYRASKNQMGKRVFVSVH